VKQIIALDIILDRSLGFRQLSQWYLGESREIIVGLCAYGIILISLGGAGLFVGIYLMCMAVVWVLLYPRYCRWWYRRSARLVYSDGSNKGVVGPQQLHADDDGLVEISAGREVKVAYSAIERTESTGQHTFIYFSSVEAIVIPRKSVTSGNYDEFIRFVWDRRANLQKQASGGS
jgi:hypothetical protein